MKVKQARNLESMIGVLLRIGVALSATVVSFGAAVHLAGAWKTEPHYSGFNREPDDLTTITGVIAGVARMDGRCIVQFGLLLLIATPIARVLFSLVAFLHERDWLYSLFTLIVLSVLGFGLFAR